MFCFQDKIEFQKLIINPSSSYKIACLLLNEHVFHFELFFHVCLHPEHHKQACYL